MLQSALRAVRDLPVEYQKTAIEIGRGALLLGGLSAVGVPVGPGFLAVTILGAMAVKILPSGNVPGIGTMPRADKILPPPEPDIMQEMVNDLAPKMGLDTIPEIVYCRAGWEIAATRDPKTNKPIILADPDFMTKHPKAETEAALGHELAHIKNGDTGLDWAKVGQFGVLSGVFIKGITDGFLAHNPFLALGVSAAVYGFSALRNMESRVRERKADETGVAATGNPDVVINAFTKFAFQYAVVLDALTDETKDQFKLTDPVIKRLVQEPELLEKGQGKVEDLLRFNQQSLRSQQGIVTKIKEGRAWLKAPHPDELERVYQIKRWKKAHAQPQPKSDVRP